MAFTIKINGADHSVDVDGDTPLLWVLRDVVGMTGTKFGCDMALCGACTVHVDGVATRSCITPIDGISTSEITTIEAIGATAAGAKIQNAWLDRGGYGSSAAELAASVTAGIGRRCAGEIPMPHCADSSPSKSYLCSRANAGTKVETPKGDGRRCSAEHFCAVQPHS